jgi:hypothetical protein
LLPEPVLVGGGVCFAVGDAVGVTTGLGVTTGGSVTTGLGVTTGGSVTTGLGVTTGGSVTTGLGVTTGGSVTTGVGVGGTAIVMVACADAVPQSLVEPSVATLMCVVTTAPGALLPTVKL